MLLGSSKRRLRRHSTAVTVTNPKKYNKFIEAYAEKIDLVKNNHKNKVYMINILMHPITTQLLDLNKINPYLSKTLTVFF